MANNDVSITLQLAESVRFWYPKAVTAQLDAVDHYLQHNSCFLGRTPRELLGVFATAYAHAFLVIAASLGIIAVWQACKRNRRHSDAVAAANLAREWRRRRLEVDLGAFRAERHDAIAAQQRALDRAVDLRKRLQSTTKGTGLTGNAAAAAAILDQMEKGPLSAQLATAEQEMAAANAVAEAAVRAERETQLAMEEERAVAAAAAAAAAGAKEEEEELGFGGINSRRGESASGGRGGRGGRGERGGRDKKKDDDASSSGGYGGGGGGRSSSPHHHNINHRWRRVAVVLALTVAPAAFGAAAVATHLSAIHTLETWSTPLNVLRAATKEADDPLGCDDIAAMAAGSPLFSSRAGARGGGGGGGGGARRGWGRDDPSSSTRLAWATTWRELPVIVHALSRPGSGGGGDDDDGGESTGYTTGQKSNGRGGGVEVIEGRAAAVTTTTKQPGLMERTRVRREAAILRALRVQGVDGVATLLGSCGTTYVTESTPFTLEQLLFPDLSAAAGAAVAAAEHDVRVARAAVAATEEKEEEAMAAEKEAAAAAEEEVEENKVIVDDALDGLRQDMEDGPITNETETSFFAGNHPPAEGGARILWPEELESDLPGGDTPDDDQKPEKKLEKKMEEERVENTKEKVKEKEETQTTATEKRRQRGGGGGGGSRSADRRRSGRDRRRGGKDKEKEHERGANINRGRLLLLSQQQQQQPHASTRTATPLRRVAVAAKDTCVPLNSERPPQCGRVIHVKVTDDDRHRGLDAANKRFGADAMSTAAASGLADDGWRGGSGGGGGGDDDDDVWCIETVPWLDPSAAARVGVGLDVARALAAVHALELPVGGTVAHGGIDTSAVGVTRRGKAVLLTLGDAMLVAPKGLFPGSSSGRGGYCRPRSGGGGGGGGEVGGEGPGQDAGAWRSREERKMRALDEKIDIHALGGILYRLMAGPGWTDPRLPTPGAVSDAAAAAAEAEGDEDAASAAEAADPSSSSTAAGKNHLGDSASDGTPSWAKCGAGPGQSPGLSRACRLVASLVARCWAHEPSNRPSAHEVVERLETILSAIRNDGGEGDDGFDSYHRDSVGDGGGGQLGAEREGGGGGGGGGVGGVSGVGGGTCLNEDCGVVACPMSTSTGATGATGADDPSPSSSNLPTLGGRAASLVEDVRACAKAGVMCANLPKERRRRWRQQEIAARVESGDGTSSSSSSSSFNEDSDHELAEEVRRVRRRHEGGGVGAGMRDVDLGSKATNNLATDGSRSRSVTAGGLSIVDNLDAVIGRAASSDVGGGGGAQDTFSYDSHEGAGSLIDQRVG